MISLFYTLVKFKYMSKIEAPVTNLILFAQYSIGQKTFCVTIKKGFVQYSVAEGIKNYDKRDKEIIYDFHPGI